MVAVFVELFDQVCVWFVAPPSVIAKAEAPLPVPLPKVKAPAPLSNVTLFKRIAVFVAESMLTALVCALVKLTLRPMLPAAPPNPEA